MERTLSIPDGLASDVNHFAATNDVPVERAYELLVSVGLDVLAERELTVTVEDDRLIMECGSCGAVFDDPGEALDHGGNSPD